MHPSSTTRRRSRGNDGGGLQDVVHETMDHARAAISDTQDAIREKASEATEATEEYVGRNPWKALAIATAVGFVLALLIRR